MLEGKFTTKLLSALRKHPLMQGAVIWKLSDRWTAGIPDFVVVRDARTTWWEVKVESNLLTKLQREHLVRLGRFAFVIRAHASDQISVLRCDGEIKGAEIRLCATCSDMKALVATIESLTV